MRAALGGAQRQPSLHLLGTNRRDGPAGLLASTVVDRRGRAVGRGLLTGQAQSFGQCRELRDGVGVALLGELTLAGQAVAFVVRRADVLAEAGQVLVGGAQ